MERDIKRLIFSLVVGVPPITILTLFFVNNYISFITKFEPLIAIAIVAITLIYEIFVVYLSEKVFPIKQKC